MRGNYKIYQIGRFGFLPLLRNAALTMVDLIFGGDSAKRHERGWWLGKNRRLDERGGLWFKSPTGDGWYTVGQYWTEPDKDDPFYGALKPAWDKNQIALEAHRAAIFKELGWLDASRTP